MDHKKARGHVSETEEGIIHSGHANRILLNSSDADSDVLADYVLALIRADTSEPELRANAIENLEDFLRESL